jgi:hypothetical protein
MFVLLELDVLNADLQEQERACYKATLLYGIVLSRMLCEVPALWQPQE